MLLIVEERRKSSGERCRRHTREVDPLRPAALTGGDGHGASRKNQNPTTLPRSRIG
jgi:hypothetical protein